MKTKPLRWIVISAFGLTAGWLCVKPATPRKPVRAKPPRTVNRLYMVTAEITNTPPAIR